MSKLIKDMITDELKTRYADCENAVWIEFVGVDGLTTTEFRTDLHKHDMRLEVVKNSLLRRAVEGGPLSKLAAKLQGPAALLTGGESPVAIAKLLEDVWMGKIQSLKLRGALIDGELIDENAIDQLSKMPTKADLQAKVALCILTPGKKIAGAIQSPGAKIAACVKEVISKLEKGETIAAA